jgi:formylglycine-generating enzyme required for sulfatase activity
MARSALVIGIARYSNFRNLEKTVNDAGAIAEILEKHGAYAIEPLPRKLAAGDENRYELDRDPKKEVKGNDLTAKLKTFLLEQAKGKDALIYFAGHGFVMPDVVGDEIGYLAATDAGKDGQNALSFDVFTKLVAKSELNNLVVLLDCCNAGNLIESSHYQAMQKVFNDKKNYYLMAACRGFERSREGAEHGIFTAAVLEVLRERVAAGEAVDLDSLFSEVSKRLKQSGQEVVRSAMGGAITLIEKARGNLAPVVFEDICPYVGLEAFTKETARFFKGRDRFVRLLLQKIAESSFVPVIGASGSGKSSLVRAGLISELEAQGWLILPPIKPGDFSDNPVMGISWVLAQLCQRADSKREISKQIASGNLEAAIACLTEQKKILLVVDQFEEVFTVCPAEKEAERQQFIDLLVGITQHPDSRLRVVTTMRADFFENCLGYRGLGEALQLHQVLLLPMNEEELREAIAAPAEAGQYELGEGLLPAILRDVRDEKNVLPLLEFALTQLWEHREKRRLTFAVYDALGGVMGALNKHADSVYDSLQPQEQEWAKRICLMLVRTGLGERDTRQRQTKRELVQLANDGALQDFQVALDQLVAGRLLVTGKDGAGEAWVDMAHEALMEKWIYFAKWREEKRDVLRLVNRIRDAFDECDLVTDQDKFLLPEGVVAQIEEVEVAINDYLTPEQQEFVQRNRYKYKPWLDLRNLPEMVDIPSGTFWMGSPEAIGLDNEKPYHQVTVKAFRMGKYPVTQVQWRTVAMSPKIEIDLSLNPSYHRGENKPVEQVAWYDAQEFCKRLSRLTGESYRLPSEVEWEYACRAGDTEYCFGDDVSQLDDYGWYSNNSGDCTIDADRVWEEVNQDASRYTRHLRQNNNGSHPVGQKRPNTWGLYDMHGNVWEWCADDWHNNYEGAPIDSQIWVKDVKNHKESGKAKKLFRGGSCFGLARNCRSGFRSYDEASLQNYNLGFRVVCVLR